ncbi:hypothetical protein CEXT_134301 [Caerostris extrusa]|uniref:Uncharacterized protein n=1 Tax=Caerostris extrusa TaxID=172846 RepID=A0AAV4XHB1_CAEEX|nr:hypothetical protein CEXT_134301 [Caerostris extrusa]
MSTAIPFISNENVDLFPVQTLLDLGSASCCLTKEYESSMTLNMRLGMKKEEINIPFSGLNNSQFTIKSRAAASVNNKFQRSWKI